MKFPGSHKPSLIILGRTTFALIVLGVAAFSLTVGYLVGYQVSGEQPVLGKPDARHVVPPDEKRVLEPTPPSAAQQQQQAVQSEKKPAPLVSINPSAPEAEAGKDEKRAQPQQKPVVIEPEKQDTKVAINAPANQQQSAAKPEPAARPGRNAQQPSAIEQKQTMPGADKNKTTEALKTAATQKATAAGDSKKGAYVVEFGAFADASRASALKSELSKKGVKAYIVPKDEKTRYTRVRAGGFATYAEAAKYASATEARTGVAGVVAKR
ncbi:MAG TPA: SPOR domain-containing protein [Dissulfurispiraceae bacterium]|nr:SPOR domain-containing protein [Dissulfurispiraceae bacterium]